MAPEVDRARELPRQDVAEADLVAYIEELYTDYTTKPDFTDFFCCLSDPIREIRVQNPAPTTPGKIATTMPLCKAPRR